MSKTICYPVFSRSLHGFRWFLKTRQFAALFTDHWKTQQGRKVATSTLYGKVKQSLAWSLGPKRLRFREPGRHFGTHREHKHRQTQRRDCNGISEFSLVAYWRLNGCEAKLNEHCRYKAAYSSSTMLLHLKHILVSGRQKANCHQVVINESDPLNE